MEVNSRGFSNKALEDFDLIDRAVDQKDQQAYAALMNAKKDPAMSRQVRSWESYIKDKAKQKGISL